jgi:hypothetical protein
VSIPNALREEENTPPMAKKNNSSFRFERLAKMKRKRILSRVSEMCVNEDE